MSPALEAAVKVASNIQSGRYVFMSVYAIQVYEWLLLYDEEHRLIHRTGWNSMKVAFLCCRYYPLISWPVILWAFVGDHDTEFCRVVVKPIFIFMIPYLTAQVMVIRAWTFSGRQTHILYFLLFAYFAVVIIQIWVLATGVEGIKESPVMKIVGKFGCIRGPGPGPLISGNRVGVMFVAACLVDFLCIFAIIARCFHLRSFQGSLGKAFVGQSVGAFILMTIIHITAGTLSFIGKDFGGGLTFPIPLVFSNIVACRLILGLRQRVSLTKTEANAEISRVVRNALALSSLHPEDDWAS